MGDIYWAGNMVGLRLSEDYMRTIKFPRLELMSHVTLKTVQAGALLGTCMVAPVMTAVKGIV